MAEERKPSFLHVVNCRYASLAAKSDLEFYAMQGTKSPGHLIGEEVDKYLAARDTCDGQYRGRAGPEERALHDEGGKSFLWKSSNATRRNRGIDSDSTPMSQYIRPEAMIGCGTGRLVRTVSRRIYDKLPIWASIGRVCRWMDGLGGGDGGEHKTGQEELSRKGWGM